MSWYTSCTWFVVVLKIESVEYQHGLLLQKEILGLRRQSLGDSKILGSLVTDSVGQWRRAMDMRDCGHTPNFGLVLRRFL